MTCDKQSLVMATFDGRVDRKTTGVTWLSLAVFCVMGGISIALFWFPVKRVSRNVEINYNEGWNAYRGAMVEARIPLYGKPPQDFGTGTAYPPLSFHLIGALGNANTVNTVGRWVSLISLLVIGAFVGLIVRREGGSVAAAIFSVLLYEIALALMLPDRIGMNDPQLLAEALSILGLYFYIHNRTSTLVLFASALCFCLAGFTKQTLIVFPAVVGIDLLRRPRRALLTWVGGMLLFGTVFTAMTFLIDGRYFLLHLTSRRAYSYSMAWSQFHRYGTLFQGLLVIATAWSVSALRSRTLFALAFIFTNGLAFLLAGGAGVDMNIFFTALATTVIACGFAVSDLQLALAGWWPDVWNATAALMFGILLFDIMIFVPGQLRRDREKIRALARQETEFTTAVEFARSKPGPALCESLLLCYEAGKPFEYEPFSVRDQINTGVIKEADVLRLLKNHHFQTVEVALLWDEGKLQNWDELRASLVSDQTDPDKQRRFTPNFMKELLADYHLSMRTSDMALFSPNSQANEDPVPIPKS